MIRLTPFTKATLDHFIFLERPAESNVADGGGGYRARAPYQRETTPDSLTPSTPDYETIGEFYAEIRACLIELGETEGGRALGHAERQLSPAAVKLPGLRLIHTIDDALAAVETIVEQGEGSPCGKANCHFTRFRAMREEWTVLETANPAFLPHLPAAHDPVMRKPAEGIERVWITEPLAARFLDLGNAVYALTLALLQHAYAACFPEEIRTALVGGAVSLMRGCADIGTGLASLPAQRGGIINAGLTFAVPRNLHGLPAEACLRQFAARLGEIQSTADDLLLPAVVTTVGAVSSKFSALVAARAR